MRLPMRLLVALLVFLSTSTCSCAGEGANRAIDPVDDAQVEATFMVGGATYKLYRGDIYRVDARAGKWRFVVQGYDPDYYQKNYVTRNGKIFRTASDGTLYAVRRFLDEDFEGADTLQQLIGIQRGWTSITLQSPSTPTVADYVRLRKAILKDGADFLDNRVVPTAEKVHSGRRALKTYSVAKTPAMVTAKASLDTELLHFVKGDDVWFSGWYYVPKNSGMPTTIMDLETTWFKNRPGIRIFLFGDKYAGFELKWGVKLKYRQQHSTQIAFPVARWVHVKYHLKLSEKPNGIVQLWQDDRKIVDARGQTLPLAHTVYNSLEIGLSAYSSGPRAATLYVDDIVISNQPVD